MRIDVDWTRCDGHGLCALLIPEHLRIAPDGYPMVVDPAVSNQTLRHARRAVAACPALALRLER